MTLTSKFVVHGKPDVRELFHFCRLLLGATNAHGYDHDEHGFSNRPGSGLPAWMWVRGPSEQLRFNGFDENDDDVMVPFDPPSFCQVTFDTTYGYKGLDGEGGGALHARYFEALGQWCDARGLAWSWFNEFQCTWYRGREGLESLGRGGANAEAWFRDTVLPAIAAGVL